MGLDGAVGRSFPGCGIRSALSSRGIDNIEVEKVTEQNLQNPNINMLGRRGGLARTDPRHKSMRDWQSAFCMVKKTQKNKQTQFWAAHFVGSQEKHAQVRVLRVRTRSTPHQVAYAHT